MWHSVILLLYCFHTSNADDPEIKLYVKYDDTAGLNHCGEVVTSKLNANETFRLSVHSDGPVYSGTCYSSNNNGINLVRGFKKESDVYVPDHVVKATMGKKLTCKLYVHECIEQTNECTRHANGKHYSAIFCKFVISIRDKGLGNLSVNGKPVKTDVAAETEDYDVYGNHSFHDGEPTNFSCQKIVNDASFVQLNYTTFTKLIIKTEKLVNGPADMYVKLTKDYGGYVDCRITDWDGARSLLIRIFVQAKKLAPRIGFLVNGLSLTPLPGTDQGRLEYAYGYYDGEEISVETLKDETYGDMNCTGQNIPEHLADFQSSWQGESISFSAIFEETEKIAKFACLVKQKYNNMKQYVSLLLVPNKFDYSPFIKGLSMGNVLARFKSNASNTIYYESDHIKEFNLRCYSKTPGPEWHYNRREVEEINMRQSSPISENEYYVKTGLFRFIDRKDSTVVNCSAPEGQVTKVVLFQKKIDTIDPLSPNSASCKIIIGCIALVVLLVVVAWVIVRIVKQKSQTENFYSNDMNYQNLPEHNEGPMVMPAQWSENMYVELGDDRNYAVPFTTSIDDMYSKPLPKAQRPMKPDYENSPYATIEELGISYASNAPQSSQLGQSSALHKDIKPFAQENPYAEVAFTGNPLHAANDDANKYVNVFGNDIYVNVKSNEDLTEPAYCEINVKK